MDQTIAEHELLAIRACVRGAARERLPVETGALREVLQGTHVHETPSERGFVCAGLPGLALLRIGLGSHQSCPK